MIVNIIGWYGTETMGDIAILDGIISVVSSIDEACKIYLGSLYPFYSQRVLLEENAVFKKNSKSIEIEIYDIKNVTERKEKISDSDILLMGGGPLMDLEELYIIRDCFEYSKKHGISTVIMGCGLGPLTKPEYIRVVSEIFDNSKSIVFRDEKSIETANSLYGNKYEYTYLGDPAIISIENFKMENTQRTDDYVAINLRDYPGLEYGGENIISDKVFKLLCTALADRYNNVKLVPMHTFFIGGDDRYYLAKLMSGVDDERIKVLHKPLNLHELYTCYMNAIACVGMRYHSVVMQTILNGNNIILDYTEPYKGKISGFIEKLKFKEFYRDRWFSLRDKNNNFSINGIVDVLESQNTYGYNYEFDRIKEGYIEIIKDCLSNRG